MQHYWKEKPTGFNDKLIVLYHFVSKGMHCFVIAVFSFMAAYFFVLFFSFFLYPQKDCLCLLPFIFCATVTMLLQPE